MTDATARGTALVTGACSGMGRETANKLLSGGYAIYVAGSARPLMLTRKYLGDRIFDRAILLASR